jgi:hypothetical protein
MPIGDVPVPHWDPKATSLAKHLAMLAGGSDEAAMQVKNTRVERLKWMQKHTLGCADTFEYTRTEMALLLSRDAETITDEEVLQHSIDSIANPNGALRQYLEHSDVAVVIGNTLFVHGVVDRNTMGYVPLHTRFENSLVKPPAAITIDPVGEWAVAMNQYLKDGLQDFADR